MKILKLFISALFSVALTITVSAQHDHSSMGSSSNMNMNMNSHMTMLPPKTETLKVWGKCDMCKARIEKIALASGATTADWNVKTKIPYCKFRPFENQLRLYKRKTCKSRA